METAINKQHVYELLDQLDTGQLAAIFHLLEVMTDPVSRSLASAPVEEEPISAEEAAALDEAKRFCGSSALRIRCEASRSGRFAKCVV
jgi:hypothetical protein